VDYVWTRKGDDLLDAWGHDRDVAFIDFNSA